MAPRPKRNISKSTVTMVKPLSKIRKNRTAKKADKKPIKIARNVETRVYSLGNNEIGLLGIGSTETTNIEEHVYPTRVTDLDKLNIVKVACGGVHVVVMSSNGDIYTWGCNDDGALGRITDDIDEEARPGRVIIDEPISQISAGDSHTAVVTAAGKIFIWGCFRNGSGRIGLNRDGDIIRLPAALQLPFGNLQKKLVKIASGTNHFVALFEDSTIISFGDGEFGQLGRFLTTRSLRSNVGLDRTGEFLTPHEIDRPLKGVADIFAGGRVTYFIKANGEVWGCGFNGDSQLGFRARTVPEYRPMDTGLNCHYNGKRIKSFDTFKPWHMISAGERHSLALNEEGKVFSFGIGYFGRLGHGNLDRDHMLVPFPSWVKGDLEKVKCALIACGSTTSHALTYTNELFAWGMGSNYQLGNGDDDDKMVPTVVQAGEDGGAIEGKIISISAGGQHSIIVTEHLC